MNMLPGTAQSGIRLAKYSVLHRSQMRKLTQSAYKGGDLNGKLFR